jgi:hypothetical protein
MDKNIISQVGSYEDACKLLGRTPLSLEQFGFLPENQRQSAFSSHKIETTIEALKQGREFDWNDTDQPKWFPVWDMETYNDGRENDGFVLSVVRYCYACTNVSARLCSFSREEAEHVATILFEDYRNLIRA